MDLACSQEAPLSLDSGAFVGIILDITQGDFKMPTKTPIFAVVETFNDIHPR